jgi:hypothetical protein
MFDLSSTLNRLLAGTIGAMFVTTLLTLAAAGPAVA